MIVSLLLACTSKGDTPLVVDTRVEGTVYLTATETTDAIAISAGQVVATGEDALAAEADTVVEPVTCPLGSANFEQCGHFTEFRLGNRHAIDVE